MENFKIEITESSRNLTKKERVMFKDTSEAIALDQATQSVFDGEFVTITPVDYVILSVHNEQADNPDYEQYLLIDTEGNRWVTGSTSFWNSFISIWHEMMEDGDPEQFSIRVVRAESKNYKGKYYLKAVLI